MAKIHKYKVKPKVDKDDLILGYSPKEGVRLFPLDALVIEGGGTGEAPELDLTDIKYITANNVVIEPGFNPPGMVMLNNKFPTNMNGSVSVQHVQQGNSFFYRTTPDNISRIQPGAFWPLIFDVKDMAADTLNQEGEYLCLQFDFRVSEQWEGASIDRVYAKTDSDINIVRKFWDEIRIGKWNTVFDRVLYSPNDANIEYVGMGFGGSEVLTDFWEIRNIQLYRS